MVDPPGSPARFVAIVVRAHDAQVCAVDAGRKVALAPHSIRIEDLTTWLIHILGPSDAVVIASRASAWPLHDSLAPLVGRVIVAHPQVETLLPDLHAASGTRDLLKLAGLHAAGLIPALWAAPDGIRDLRALMGHRRRLILQHAEAGRTLDEILRRHYLIAPGASRLGADRPGWWAAQALSPAEHASARDSLASLNRANTLLARVEERLHSYSTQAPWQAQVDQIVSKIGMRRSYAIVLLAAIGDVTRFPSANNLVGYARLAGNRQDDRSKRAGLHGNEGWGEIRATMLDVAEGAIRDDPHWRDVFSALEQRIGSQRAIVAVARKLLVVLWRTLSAAAAGAAPASEQAIQRAA